MARVAKGGVLKREGSFLVDHSKSLIKERYILITSLEYAFRECYETREVLDLDYETACGWEQSQR